MGQINPATVWTKVMVKLHEKEFQRYLLVGLVGVILFEVNFYFANHFLPYLVSYLLCFEAVTDINFTMHDSWTFRDEKHFSRWRRFTIFQTGAIGYRLIQYAAFFFLSLILNLYLALLIAIFIAFGYSYTLNKRLTWKRKES